MRVTIGQMNADTLLPGPALMAVEHPLDVLTFIGQRQAAGIPVAAVFVTETEGGAVRAPGAILAVDAEGTRCGYLSGGCIDEDVAVRAVRALETGRNETLRYGAGSPFMDISLPCGGAITCLSVPDPDGEAIAAAVDSLSRREMTQLTVSEKGISADPQPSQQAWTFSYRPKLRLRIAGRGADAVALSRIAAASGFDVELWSPEAACLNAAAGVNGVRTTHLQTPRTLPSARDDAHTAFVLMFHDGDWEAPLLQDALQGPAFYIGAVGSRRTHDKRCDLLQVCGVPVEATKRIRGPAGLVPSLRDASMLALSVLAEIVEAFHSAEKR